VFARSLFRKRNSLHLLIALLTLFLLLIPPARAQEPVAVEVTEADLHQGTVLAIGEMPVTLQDQSHKAGDVFDYKTPEGPTLRVKVLPSRPVNGRNLRLPVEIVDVVLAKGTKLNLTLPDGTTRVVNIPRKRVFIPQKFYIILRGAGEAGQHGGRPGDLILEVYPKLTTKLRLSMTSTTDEGLIAIVDYGDQATVRVKDFNKRLGRRDLDLQLYSSTNTTNRMGVDIQNLQETYSHRIVGLLYNRQIRPENSVLSRLDYIREEREVKPGSNYFYNGQRQEFEFGNVDRRVEDSFHAQTRLFRGNTDLTLRLEGVEVHRLGLEYLPTAVIRNAGVQMEYYSEDGTIDAIFGNLKVEENELMGKIDPHLNFVINLSRPFGTGVSFYDARPLEWGGSLALRLMGVGEDSWMRARLQSSLGLGNNILLQFNLNDDFFRITGQKKGRLWQDRTITLIQTRDILSGKDLLSRLKVEYVFADYNWHREGSMKLFQKRLSVGVGKNLNLMGFDVPLEFYLQKEGKTLRFRFTFSLRQWL